MIETLTKAMQELRALVAQSRKGLAGRRLRNQWARANGTEPEPGCGRGSGIKRWMRYHRRVA